MLTTSPAAISLVGANLEVDLVTGATRRYTNLDYAASTPSLVAVRDGVEAFLPWYSSVHRGAGLKSQVATAAYEGARDAVRVFVGARSDDALIFTRNTTDSMNLMASCLPENTRVLAFPLEHHANMLPWRRGDVRYLAMPNSEADALALLEHALSQGHSGPTLVSVTGASNVTGEVWPIQQLAELAHKHGARLLVDAAQLAPHVPIDMRSSDIDYLALSGHKLYAPYGAGILVGRADWLAARDPFLRGGGAVRFVTLDEVLWADLPDRQEAGSPNVVGAVALGIACQTLSAMGMNRLAARETELHSLALERLSKIPRLSLYTLWSYEHPHIGLLTLNLGGYDHGRLATILSAEYGIGVRHGCFCAHPLLVHLLRLTDEEVGRIREDLAADPRTRLPGAVRISMGLDTTAHDIEIVADALEAISEGGPAWSYREAEPGEWVPDPDPRRWPDLGIALSRGRAGGESS